LPFKIELGIWVFAIAGFDHPWPLQLAHGKLSSDCCGSGNPVKKSLKMSEMI